MFDIGFSELMVIGLVALIVIGPERLPRVARTLGHLAGRLQRYVADVKADINREVELDELRKMKDIGAAGRERHRGLGAERTQQDRERAERGGASSVDRRRADEPAETPKCPRKPPSRAAGHLHLPPGRAARRG